MSAGSLDTILTEFLQTPAGFKPRELACAWCADGDRISLTRYERTQYVAHPYNHLKTIAERTTGEPPQQVVRDWLTKHAGCEARWNSVRVRTVIAG